jgi:hypothetical protein
MPTILGTPVRISCGTDFTPAAERVAKEDRRFCIPELICLTVSVELTVRVPGSGTGGRPLHQLVDTHFGPHASRIE